MTNPIEGFNTDPVKQQLDRLATDQYRKKRRTTYKLQRSKKNPMIPLASGVLSISLGLGVLVSPAYADSEPILEPKIGHEPKIHVQIKHKNKQHKKNRHHHKNEARIDVFTEPKVSPRVEKKEVSSVAPSFEEKREKSTKEVESRVESRVEPLVAPRVETKENTKPVVGEPKEPVLEPFHSEETSFAVASSKSTKPAPTKSTPKLKTKTDFDVDSDESNNTTNDEANETKDATPLQKTENGGELPKTAGNHMNFVIGGLLLIAGGYQLKRYRELNA